MKTVTYKHIHMLRNIQVSPPLYLILVSLFFSGKCSSWVAVARVRESKYTFVLWLRTARCQARPRRRPTSSTPDFDKGRHNRLRMITTHIFIRFSSIFEIRNRTHLSGTFSITNSEGGAESRARGHASPVIRTPLIHKTFPDRSE